MGARSAEELRQLHPQQTEFTFGPITLSSKFDSGNMSRAEETELGSAVSPGLFTRPLGSV